MASARGFLGRAVLASVAVHALFLGLLPVWQPVWRHAQTPPVIARIASSEVPVAAPRMDSPASAAVPMQDEPVGKSTKDLAPTASVAAASPASRADPTIEPDGGSIAQFRIEVMLKARELRRYPRAAIQQGWQGRAVISVQVDSNGRVESVTVRTSTGYSLLDTAGAEMAHEAAAQVPVPPSLRGREFGIELPLAFVLQDPA